MKITNYWRKKNQNKNQNTHFCRVAIHGDLYINA